MSQVVKILSEVEVNSWASNQHEFNGVARLKDLFGKEKQYFAAKFFYLSNRGIEDRENGSLTWYDARENHPSRTEYRLYYDAALPLKKAKAGDTLLIAPDCSGRINVFIIANGTQLASFLVNLIGQIGTEWRIVTDGDDVEAIENALQEYRIE